MGNFFSNKAGYTEITGTTTNTITNNRLTENRLYEHIKNHQQVAPNTSLRKTDDSAAHIVRKFSYPRR